ncbi:MAG: hypothetical protein RR253_06090, partial [Oscillospiraceae bacterium]
MQMNEFASGYEINPSGVGISQYEEFNTFHELNRRDENYSALEFAEAEALALGAARGALRKELQRRGMAAQYAAMT